MNVILICKVVLYIIVVIGNNSFDYKEEEISDF
jgi:hypothetical protein